MTSSDYDSGRSGGNFYQVLRAYETSFITSHKIAKKQDGEIVMGDISTFDTKRFGLLLPLSIHTEFSITDKYSRPFLISFLLPS